MLGPYLDVPIKYLQLDDPHLHKAYEDDKFPILDLLATLDNETQVNIEIQLIGSMYKNGMNIKDIAKFSGLPVADIQKLLED